MDFSLFPQVSVAIKFNCKSKEREKMAVNGSIWKVIRISGRNDNTLSVWENDKTETGGIFFILSEKSKKTQMVCVQIQTPCRF